MANPSPLRRGSSTGHLPLQPLSTTSSTPTPSTAAASTNSSEPPVHPSLLQPRVAVVLNVPPPWHPWLFTLRLVSILPALWWGLPSALQLLIRILPGPELVVVVPSATAGTKELSVEADARLINYTPQATMVRLLTINACNAYITAGVLSLAGGFQDPRLLLPGWIGIATTLTVMYHITHQKINIRKETSTSINVFSIASFLSMVTLLAHMHLYTPQYPQIPLIASGRRAWDEASRVVAQVRGSIEQHDGL
ncbi:uncharacterized protein NECHADRAFT_92123 [Fusarium vanettenii 77-13-4]|uniref:N-glycosylation protein EOS1 n=1 Tax=Fusarium vanettenii (strain ATCC MYA-4622 / CBS 123669 / FGSC 9596 / NRRL 45880 / 77-13-4) TaxID=660122 RepID=C7YN68_FUSV7|nr:uncharacterized protein NECHADRAFT_92123 [Fusarium vanettenii 77-13-4]EEU47570.1 predicted protein [Fusarium vanettenii 77-13-4]